MIVYLKHMWMLLIIVSIPTVFALYLTARVVCGHFLELAKQPDQGSSYTPTDSCFQGISLSAFRYAIPDIHSVCQ